MASGRLRIGHNNPGQRVLVAEHGQFNLLGQTVSLLSSSSNILTNGQQATITGSGFGTGPTLLAWDTFEQGTHGAAITTPEQGTYSFSEMTYTNAVAHSGTKCAFSNPDGGDQFRQIIVPLQNQIKLYCHFWFRRTAYTGDGQLKLVQIHGQDFVLDFAPGWHMGGLAGSWWATYLAREQGDDVTTRGNIDEPNANAWMEVEIIGRQSSTPGASDGWVRLYFDRVLQYERTNIVTRFTSRFWGELLLCDGATNFTTYPDLFMDELLAQHGWGRIVLSNASTLAASTIRVPQRLISWNSSGPIQYTVFAGILSGGPVWEHAIDDDDVTVLTTPKTLQL